MKTQIWSVVLASGSDGRQVEETLARLAPISSTERAIIVATERDRPQVSLWPSATLRSRVVFQAEDRGTAAALLFGLVKVLASDPAALVAIAPSPSEAVLVARGLTMFDLCRQRLPELAAPFVGALTLPPLTRDRFLAMHYRQLPTCDLAHGVLAQAVAA